MPSLHLLTYFISTSATALGMPSPHFSSFHIPSWSTSICIKDVCITPFRFLRKSPLISSMFRIELQYYSRFVEEIRVSNHIETSSTSLTHHFGPLVGFHASPLPGYGRRHFDRPRVMLVPEQKPNRFRKVSRCLYMHRWVHSISDLMFFLLEHVAWKPWLIPSFCIPSRRVFLRGQSLIILIICVCKEVLICPFSVRRPLYLLFV